MELVVAYYKRFLFKVGNLNRDALLVRLRTTGLYFLVPIIGMVLSSLTSPIFARYLTAEEFGYYGYFSSILGIVGCFYGLLFQTYFMSIYFKVSEERRKQVLTSLILFNLLWNLFFFPVSYAAVYLYFKLSHSKIPFFPFALLVFGAGLLATYKGFVQVDYRLNRQPLKFFFFVTGYRLLTVFLSVYFVAYSGMGLTGRLLGVIVGEILFFLISLSYLLKGQKLRIEKDIIRQAFKIIFPLFPAAFLYLPILTYDNIVLERMHQPSEMGLYNIGRGVAGYLYFALFPFFQTFEPDIYKSASTRNFKELKRLIIFLIVIVVFSLVGFWIFAPFLIDYLTAGKYIASIKYANILVVTSGLMIIFSIFDAIINALQKTRRSLLINSITAGLCILSYTVGGLYFKQIGVAVASVVTYMALILLQIIFVINKLRTF